MYQEISKLLMYGDLPQDEILYKLGQLFEQFEVGEYNKTELVRDINNTGQENPKGSDRLWF